MKKSERDKLRERFEVAIKQRELKIDKAFVDVFPYDIIKLLDSYERLVEALNDISQMSRDRLELEAGDYARQALKLWGDG